LRRNQRPRASFPLAGFEVTLIGRSWVTPEALLAMRVELGHRISLRVEEESSSSRG
jgi:hypothetical protein